VRFSVVVVAATAVVVVICGEEEGVGRVANIAAGVFGVEGTDVEDEDKGVVAAAGDDGVDVAVIVGESVIVGIVDGVATAGVVADGVCKVCA